MTRTVPDIAVTFVAEHEGCVLRAYRDPAGVLTAGIGHTGADVVDGMEVTQAQADAWLHSDLDIAAKRLERVVNADVIARLTDGQYAALLSFVFNLGAGPWTIWKKLNAGDLAGVPDEINRFVYAGGKRLNGLVRRRADEVKLWATPEPDEPPAPSSAVLRANPDAEPQLQPEPPPVVVATPPATTPAHKSTTVWGAWCAAAVPLVLAAGPFVLMHLGMSKDEATQTAIALAMLLGGGGGQLTLIGRADANIKPLGKS